jgi:2-phosphosulfolactate phosphatase
VRKIAFGQVDYRIRFERGERGLHAIGRDASVIVVVDVLSFSTAVDIAVCAGACVLAISQQADALKFAERRGALLAVPRSEQSAATPYSLSPNSLSALPAGARLVLPSPNGAALIAYARELRAPVIVAGCLRNASAVGAFVCERSNDGVIAIVAAGERWPDGTLRPALEDDLGAGAILASLNLEEASPEAVYVARGFLEARASIAGVIEASMSGRELIESGYRSDVERASEYDSSRAVPLVSADGFLSDAS